MSFDVYVIRNNTYYTDDVAVEKVKTFVESNPTKLNEFLSYEAAWWGTLLHFSCFFNRPKVVSYLLSKNADITKCFEESKIERALNWTISWIRESWHGLTAKQIAEKRGYGNIVTLFEQYEREQAAREQLNIISNSIVCQVQEKPDPALQSPYQQNPSPVLQTPQTPQPKPVQEKPDLVLQPSPSQQNPSPVLQPDGYFSIKAVDHIKQHLSDILQKKNPKTRTTCLALLEEKFEEEKLENDVHLFKILEPIFIEQIKDPFDFDIYSSTWNNYFPTSKYFSNKAVDLIKQHLSDILQKKTPKTRTTCLALLEENFEEKNLENDFQIFKNLESIFIEQIKDPFDFNSYSSTWNNYFPMTATEKPINNMSSGSIPVTEVNDSIAKRVMDVSNEPSQILNPIIGLFDRPLCSFDETLQSLEHLIPGIENLIFSCTMFANNINNNKKQNLLNDEISSINLFTHESNPRENSLYYVINKALREQDRFALKPFFPYLHLLLHSMCKLPKCSPGTIVWRGVPSNISSNYTKGKKIIWWGLSSCTKDMNALDTFLGKESDRTLFSVQINSAVEISQFSAFPNEKEVIVFPCVTFEVQNVYSPRRNLWIVQLKEIFSPAKIIVGFDYLGM